MGITTNLVEAIKLGCRRGLDSETIVLAEIVGVEEERESVEFRSALSRGPS